ncbi:hypothetical protein ACRYI5_08775 [Furfurilactobacillus sp. WILCCON 0119]
MEEIRFTMGYFKNDSVNFKTVKYFVTESDNIVQVLSRVASKIEETPHTNDGGIFFVKFPSSTATDELNDFQQYQLTKNGLLFNDVLFKSKNTTTFADLAIWEDANILNWDHKRICFARPQGGSGVLETAKELFDILNVMVGLYGNYLLIKAAKKKTVKRYELRKSAISLNNRRLTSWNLYEYVTSQPLAHGKKIAKYLGIDLSTASAMLYNFGYEHLHDDVWEKRDDGEFLNRRNKIKAMLNKR